MTYNEFQQPIGESLPDYKEGQFPKTSQRPILFLWQTIR